VTEKKTCYVIMPFSKTESTSENEWKKNFNNLFKPIIEDPQTGYECKKSELDTGSFTKEIVMNLKDADVVLADITDYNHNVMWELGVRHTLSKRTIMVVREDLIEKIPSDIKNYGVVTYQNTITGFQEFKEKIHNLLKKIEKNPEKPDSPVYDFLKESDLILSDYNKQRIISQLHSLLSEISFNLTVWDTIQQNIKSKKKDFEYFRFFSSSIQYLFSTYLIPNEQLYHDALLTRVYLRTLDYMLDDVHQGKLKPSSLSEPMKDFRKQTIKLKNSILEVKKSIQSGSFIEELPPVILIGNKYEKMFKEK